ncbi:unnamed protein product [Prorocentrum cordatum]|uniref:Uncharacterized protein n=1 Tax=Prorocentrum cordatum TaxID=2364126 RepID=A0ABN9X7X6_9DINO|nr:unnamed protein product [Polarella glacialis]
MYAEEVACMVVMGKVDSRGDIPIGKAIDAVKNYGRSGLGKELFKQHKWANRPGMMRVAELLRSVGLVAGFQELDDTAFTPINGSEPPFPPWMHSIRIKTMAGDDAPISMQIFMDRQSKLKNEMGTAVPRSAESFRT